MLSAMLLFPVTWIVVAIGVAAFGALRAAPASLAVTPLSGYAALVFFERLDRLRGGVRALALFLFRRRAFLRLAAERRAIRREIIKLGEEVEKAAARG